MTQLTTRDALGLRGESGDAAREVRRAEEGQTNSHRQRDRAVDHQVEHRGAGFGDESVGATGDDERADDALVGHDRYAGTEGAVETEVVDARSGGASRSDGLRHVTRCGPLTIRHLVAIAVRDEVEASFRVARDDLDGQQIVTVAERGGVVDACAANQIAHVSAGKIRVSRDAERRRARDVHEPFALRARERTADARVRREQQDAEREHDGRAGERGHLEPHGKAGRGSQGRGGRERRGTAREGRSTGAEDTVEAASRAGHIGFVVSMTRTTLRVPPASADPSTRCARSG